MSDILAKDSAGWIRLRDIQWELKRWNPSNQRKGGHVTAWDQSQFVLALHQEYDQLICFTYDTLTDQWTPLKVTTDPRRQCDASNSCGFAVNQSEKKLYLFPPDRTDHALQVTVCDIATNQRTQAPESEENRDRRCQPYSVRAVFVDGIVHCFVSYLDQPYYDFMGDISSQDYHPQQHCYKVKHFILSEDKTSFSKIFEIPMNVDYTNGNPILVKRLNSILLIQEGVTRKGEIWRFTLDDHKWAKIEGICIESRANLLATTLSQDEKFIVMMDWNINILVLDISNENEFKIFKTDIGSPVNDDAYDYRDIGPKGVDGIVCLGGGLWSDMVVIGWTKRLYGRKEFKKLQMPPLYLLQMIAHWLSTEELHYIRHREEDSPAMHFVISMERILASIK